MQVRLEVAAISTAAEYSSQEQTALASKLMTGLSAVDGRIARVEEMLRSQSEKVQMNQHRQVGTLYNVSAQPERQSPTSTYLTLKKPKLAQGLGVRATPHLECRRGVHVYLSLTAKDEHSCRIEQRSRATFRWICRATSYKPEMHHGRMSAIPHKSDKP